MIASGMWVGLHVIKLESKGQPPPCAVLFISLAWLLRIAMMSKTKE